MEESKEPQAFQEEMKAKENFENKPELKSTRSSEAKLREFQEEMKKEGERQRKEGVAHLMGVNFEELTEADMAIWEKVKSGKLTEEDLLEYEKTVVDSEYNLLPGVSTSSLRFLEFILNRATVIFWRRQPKSSKM